jgi:hypothetical protein
MKLTTCALLLLWVAATAQTKKAPAPPMSPEVQKAAIHVINTFLSVDTSKDQRTEALVALDDAADEDADGLLVSQLNILTSELIESRNERESSTTEAIETCFKKWRVNIRRGERRQGLGCLMTYTKR